MSKFGAEVVHKYIREQKVHHAQRDYKAELLELLARHEVEFDERYVWD